MMRHDYRSTGFTLIEVILVMAITSLLLAGIIASQSSVRRNNAFTDSVDQVQTAMKALQNEARSGVSTRASGGGASQYVIEGKIAEFDPASPTAYTTYILVGYGSGDTTHSWAKCNRQDITLPDGMTYKDATSAAVIFRLDPHQVYTVSNYDDQQSDLNSDVIPLTDAAACTAAADDGTTPLPPVVVPPPVNPQLVVSGGSGSGGAFQTGDTVTIAVSGYHAGDGCVIKDDAGTVMLSACSGTFPSSKLQQNKTSNLTAYVSDTGSDYPSNTVAVTTVTAVAGEQLTYPPAPRSPQYIHVCQEDSTDTTYITQGSPRCLPGGDFLEDYPDTVPRTFYDVPCATTVGSLRYVYISADESCPTGTAAVGSKTGFVPPAPNSQSNHLAAAAYHLGAGILAVARSPLRWVAPDVQAASAGPATNVLDPNNYTTAAFTAAQSLHFVNPDDATQTGVINISPPNNDISWGVN